MLSWDDPIEDNGVIQRYTVHYFCTDPNCEDKQSFTTERNLLVTGLHPYTQYTFVVSASTVKGDGPASKSVTKRTLEAGKKSLKCWYKLCIHNLY